MPRKQRIAAPVPPQVSASAWANFHLKSGANASADAKANLNIRGRDPRPYLAGAAPGLWATNHLEELSQIKGWQFVAIRQKSIMCSQAECKVHRVEDPKGLQDRLERVERALVKARDIPCPITSRYKSERLELKREQLARKLDRCRERIKKAGPESVATDRTPAPPEHGLSRLMKRPNPEWSLNTFLFALTQQIAATGVGLVWCVRNQLGVPVELYVCPTGLMVPRLPSPEYPKGHYWLTPLSVWGQEPQDIWTAGAIGQALLTGAILDARDVKKICWPHPLYLTDGLSPMSAGSLWVDVGQEIDRSTWYKFQNAERPGLILQQSEDSNADASDIAQLREDLKADSAGTPNTGKHLFVPKGVTANPWQNAETELDFVGSREQIRNMNLALHGMSPISCGFADVQAYAAYWAALKQTTDLAIQPTLNLIAGELTEFVGEGYADGKHEITLTAPAIDDPELLESRLATDITAGNVLTVKEYRALRGLPPFGDERDNEFVGTKVTANVADINPEVPGVQVGAEEDPNAVKPDADKPDAKDPADGPGLRSPFRDAPPGRDKALEDVADLLRKSLERPQAPELLAAVEKLTKALETKPEPEPPETVESYKRDGEGNIIAKRVRRVRRKAVKA